MNYFGTIQWVFIYHTLTSSLSLVLAVSLTTSTTLLAPSLIRCPSRLAPDLILLPSRLNQPASESCTSAATSSRVSSSTTFICQHDTTGEQFSGYSVPLTEKPGVILRQVRVPGEARDFSPKVKFRCRLSYWCPYSPPRAVACFNMCVHVKNAKHCQPYHWSGRTKMFHSLVWMGCPAFPAAVPYPGKATI